MNFIIDSSISENHKINAFTSKYVDIRGLNDDVLENMTSFCAINHMHYAILLIY